MLNTQASNQKGATLIEVLVSVVIVAFGLLGLAGLLVKGASLGASVYNRTIVTQKIYELADRMRLNPAGVQKGNYNSYSFATAPAACPDCPATGCSTTSTPTMAAYDFCQWSQEVARAIPAPASGNVAQVTGNGDGTFTVTVNWNEKDSKIKQTFVGIQSYTLTVRP